MDLMGSLLGATVCSSCKEVDFRLGVGWKVKMAARNDTEAEKEAKSLRERAERRRKELFSIQTS